MSIYVECTPLLDFPFSFDEQTILICMIYEICRDLNSERVNLHILIKDDVNPKLLFASNFIYINEFNVISEVDVPEIAKHCVWPVIVANNRVVSGLCAVARQIIKSSGKNELRDLLGFKESTLLACSETSIWTKFCEIDAIEGIRELFLNPQFYFKDEAIYFPECLTKFEYHMRQPVRAHNIYKLARKVNNDKNLKSSIPIKDLNLNHKFAEGISMTLVDILLYYCFGFFYDYFDLSDCEEIPCTRIWLESMSIALSNKFYKPNYQILVSKVGDLKVNTTNNKIIHASVAETSLYSSDPTRNKTEKNVNVSIPNIEVIFNVLQEKVTIFNAFIPYGFEVEFDWYNIPLDANPKSGALPKKRADRKCQQLENLTKAVLKISANKQYRIVDFCSGCGHLGILLAILLPNCNIILVENKEKSLKMAEERIEKLNLTNIDIVQCNVDYFIGGFDVGVSLHACGVATDLVMQKCIKTKANFVSTPCCYGNIRNCHQVSYPRSNEFSDSVGDDDYLNVAHGADQTHDKDNPKTENGFRCMDIIDTDRILYAEQFGYDVYLGKMQPTSCTPKNNVLVGICK